MDFGGGNYGYPQHEEAYDQVYNQPHEGRLSHEVLGGAAAFAAMRAYEKHQAANGMPPQHQLAKEILAGIVGGEVDKLIETKGLDEVDAMKARHHARQEADRMFDQSYGRQYSENPGYGGPPPQYEGGQYGGGQPYEGGAPYGGQQYEGPPGGGGAYGGQQGYGQQGYGEGRPYEGQQQYEGGYRQQY